MALGTRPTVYPAAAVRVSPSVPGRSLVAIAVPTRAVPTFGGLSATNTPKLVLKRHANRSTKGCTFVIGKHLKTELDRAPAGPKPDIERALRRLLERDLAERSRPHTRWSGKISLHPRRKPC